MLILIAYIVTFYAITKLRKTKRLRCKPFPLLKMKKDGIVFYSHNQHKIKINTNKYLQIGNSVYIKYGRQVVKITNVDRAFVEKNYLYFRCLGKVKISVNCLKFYRYFNIDIVSSKFSLAHQKQVAILNFIEVGFNAKCAHFLNRYINNIQGVFNIVICSKKVIVKQNKLHLPFVLKYKVNNIIKQVYINETLEENKEI